MRAEEGDYKAAFNHQWPQNPCIYLPYNGSPKPQTPRTKPSSLQHQKKAEPKLKDQVYFPPNTSEDPFPCSIHLYFANHLTVRPFGIFAICVQHGAPPRTEGPKTIFRGLIKLRGSRLFQAETERMEPRTSTAIRTYHGLGV